MNPRTYFTWSGVPLLILAVGFLVALLLFWRGCDNEPLQPPKETPPTVEKSEAEVNEGRPTGKPTGGLLAPVIGQRPAVVVRTVTTTRPDSVLARRYGELATAYAKYRLRMEDSLARLRAGRPPPAPLPPGEQLEKPAVILPPVAGSYNGRDLTLWLTQTDGNVMRATARVRPRYTFRVGQGDFTDTLPLITSDPWVVRQTREAADCLPESAVIGGGGGALATQDWGGALLGFALAEVVCLVAD